jgi:hypothetical protein
LTKKYANICGIAIEDLDLYFGEHIEYLTTLADFEIYGDLANEILAWYDGYSWDGLNRVINPFSLLSFFSQERFASFWYMSGTPKFLVDLLKKKPQGYAQLENLEISEWAIDVFDINKIAIAPLLFQTGYLTIKEVQDKLAPPIYLLEMPNHEVRLTFNLHILAEFTETEGQFAEASYRLLKEALAKGELSSMLNTMKALFASIPYQLHISHEHYYHSIFYCLMNLLGFDIDSEVSVAGGRVDAVLELADKVYVMEFKYQTCAANTSPSDKQKLFEKALREGMQQIEDRGYYKKYLGSGKMIYQAAFAFLGRDDIEMKVEKKP